MIEDFPDLNCDVVALCTDKLDSRIFHSDQSTELRGTHDYLRNFFENKTQIYGSRLWGVPDRY